MFRSIVHNCSFLLRRSRAASLHSQHVSILIRGSSIRFISDSKQTSAGNTTTSSAKNSDTPNNRIGNIPIDLLYTMNDPKPVRHEILESTKPLTTNDLENWDIDINRHREPVGWSDKIAFVTVKLLRKPTDWFFKKKYIHRAVMLETVAAVPGMVAGTVRHLRSLRKLKHDGGWIDHLLHEAENERMHLMTWMAISRPNLWERALIAVVQGVFYNCFFALYLASPKTAHRMVGYLEEEAIVSYTSFLNEIDNGHIENTNKIPDLAIDYWNLDRNTATLRDVVLAVRADEATHRDTNHHFADRLLFRQEDLRKDAKQVFKESDLSNKTQKMAGLSHAATEKWKE